MCLFESARYVLLLLDLGSSDSLWELDVSDLPTYPGVVLGESLIVDKVILEDVSWCSLFCHLLYRTNMRYFFHNTVWLLIFC